MKVGLCLIATRKYKTFVTPLLNDVDKHFFLDDDLSVYLFTDDFNDHLDIMQPYISRFEVIQLPISAYKFPQASLYRFKMFNTYEDDLRGEDVLYFMDVDMEIIADVGRDMLPVDDMVGVHHARCWSAEGTWELRLNSTAYVPPEKRQVYYAGGVFGGYTEPFFAMSKELETNIRRDEVNGIMALWHDESHLNRYFAYHPPTILPPTYCFPPNPAPELAVFTDPKIMPIIKDHKEVRR